jgi:H+/gluconate symporter-like permease
MDFGVLIIILSLVALIIVAYRGFSVILMAPIIAVLAATLSGAGYYAIVYRVIYGKGRNLY